MRNVPVTIPDSIRARVEGYFDRDTFSRGLALASEGRVRMVRSEWPVVAQVWGEEAHVVTVHHTLASRSLRAECSCEALDCEHAAAATLTALAEARALAAARVEEEAQLAVGEWLSEVAVASGGPVEREVRNTVAYVLAPAEGGRGLALTIHRAAVLRDGRLGTSAIMAALGDPTRGAPPWVEVDDLRRIALLRAVSRAAPRETALRLDRVDAALLLDLAGTERLFWKRTETEPLRPGPTREGTLVWRECEDAPGSYVVALEDDLVLVGGRDLCYVDVVARLLGRFEAGVSAALVQRLLHAPPVPGSMLPAVHRSLAPLLGDAARLAWPPGFASVTESSALPPVPHLGVRIEADPEGKSFLDARAWAVYGDERYELGVWDPRRPAARDMVEEARRRRRLDALLEGAGIRGTPGASLEVFAQARAVAQRLAPALVEEGWVCAIEDLPSAEPMATPSGWVEELVPMQADRQWFSLELGVVIAGRTVSLLPILLEAIRDGTIPLDPEALRTQPIPGTTLRLPDGELVYVPADRLRRWIAPLLELRLRGLDRDEKLALPAAAAARLDDAETGRFAGGEALAELRARFQGLLALEPRHEVASFAGTLRPYQRVGLAWFRWLHDGGYGGLLADDMGLGKTVQVLAFLEELRREGQLDGAPALVVAPRSVVGHWRDEALRFAPALRPVVHLGPKRARRAEDLLAAGLVLTSYQTLLGDSPWLGELAFATVVFDEAQVLKNPKTRIRRTAAGLQGRSRFCLSGTPIENHLGELWSQIDLVMPGLLGRRSTFEAAFRQSIEKYTSKGTLEILRQRIRPFMLRRSKRVVALELPPKTEIVELVDLSPAERDLYESLRLNLDAKVRKATEARGVHGARMTILEALLKLRQCCCHPQLTGAPTAGQGASSAKLQRLMAMLGELVEQGRSTLVFSQFTSMLSLVGRACQDAALPYLELTGSTRDRDRVVRAFQEGEVPVLLVSLKAGGTGLNLHRADTVIHYDPWWNPAAEDQASDRAHRIGQAQHVFVYRLVAKGTLEERILELQRDKRTLSAAILEGGGASELAAHDVQALYYQLV